MRSPILAMLWEIWRLTRVEAAWRLAGGIVGAWTVLGVFAAFAPDRPAFQDFGVAIALVVLVVPHTTGWISLTRLTGGMPGFPFSLHYTLPVRTTVLVGVPMAYLTVGSATTYLVAALLMRLTSGHPFPLLPVAAWIAALTVVLVAANWLSRNPVFWMLSAAPAVAAWLLLADHRLNAEEIQGSFDWPPYLWATRFDFPLTDYAFIGAIALASLGAVVARVARERHGDMRAIPLTFGDPPDELIGLFRFRCPTSSPTLAQLWFELKSGGLPLVTIGAVVAILNPLFFAVTGYIDAWLSSMYARTFAIMFATISLLILQFLWHNAFGVRWRRGRWYPSAFETTLSCGTSRLAALKVLVRSVCALAALTLVVVSLWVSLPLLGPGKIPELLRSGQRAIEGGIGALTGYQQLALSAVASIGLVVTVALLAALWALGARYPRRMNRAAGSLLLLHCLVLFLLVLNGRRGIGLFVEAMGWIDAPLLLFATIYLTWKVFAERLLSLRSTVGIVLISAAFGVAWVTVLRAAGVQLAGMPTMDAAWMLSPSLLPLMASAVAPWSLSRIRHM